MPSMPCYRMPLFREKEKMQTEKVRIDEVLEKEYKLTSWDHDIFHKVMEHWDGIAKPLDGMGQFEPMLAKIGAIQKTLEPRFDVGRLLVFCADNGVVAEGISQSPQEVTATCAKNIAAGQTAVGRMASLAGCQIRVYDVGINTRETICNVIDEKVAHGTRDFYKEPAMDETQMRQALQCGLDAVYACKCDNLAVFLFCRLYRVFTQNVRNRILKACGNVGFIIFFTVLFKFVKIIYDRCFNTAE